MSALLEIIATNPAGFTILFLSLFGVCLVTVVGFVLFVDFLDNRSAADRFAWDYLLNRHQHLHDVRHAIHVTRQRNAAGARR